METRFGQLTVTHSPRGVPTYRVEAFHDGLHKFALIRANDTDTLQNKLRARSNGTMRGPSGVRRKNASEEHYCRKRLGGFTLKAGKPWRLRERLRRSKS
jgi:hypothetical protein